MYLANTSSGSILPGRGLINPAFVIKIVPATDALQQPATPGRDNPSEDFLDNLKVGNEVKAKVGKKTVIGKVERIIKNSIGDGIYVVISDSKGKTHKIEGTRIEGVKSGIVGSDKERLISSPALFSESKFLTFGSFCKTNS
jgi:hypothetical protein